jgi:hypothetical protein
MSKSIYTDHFDEIHKMKTEGKTNAEIVKFLNANYHCGATVNSLKSFLKRQNDKRYENPPGKEMVTERGINREKENPRKQEAITTEKLGKFIANEVEMQLAVKEFYKVKEKLNEAYGVFSVINHEFGEAAAKLRSYASRYKVYFFMVGAMIFITVFALFTGYHIHCCRQEIAFHYIVALCCGPAGILVGLTTGFTIADIINKKRIKKLEDEYE